ncbi:hypothetical protein EV195_105239 [Tenacibaculum skagerrakense]|uniref:Uncharacterized protein n=1 Tax=Tenacibaculum skagerrakense TaxID=186571 RepID=A0A4R2NTL8_9FLAO|nr:hypothetical protein [Tenacibaculum skagerrakense]TCP24808.1 hypothetical protein EV195_105239 [Tenacibaculum skagerrakense]
MENNFLDLIKNGFNDLNWKSIKVVFDVNDGSIGYETIQYITPDNEIQEHWIPFKKIKEVIDFIRESYNSKKNTNEKFNKVEVSLILNENSTVRYYLDEAEELKNKINTENVFFQWLNDNMMNRIFDFEKGNNLLTPNYDEDGDFIDFQSSWDQGIFTFNIVNKEVFHKIQLFKNEESRLLSMPLPDYLVNGILEHHYVTNNELTEVWEPWNTLVIKSPHNSIPYDDWKKYVTYSLEDKIV